MSDVQVIGADEFLRLSKALKRAGQKGLRADLNKAMKKAAKPLVKVARDAFRDELPSRGGLGAFVAGKRTAVTTRTGKDPGVTVKVAKQDPRLDSSGRLVHPVFGRPQFVVQQVPSGVFSRAMQAEAPAIRKDLEHALEEIAARIVREVG